MEFDAPLGDGLYETNIIWAEEVSDGALSIDLVITNGVKKGELLTLRANDLTYRDTIALVGRPCGLRVTGGSPEILF